MNEPAGDAAGKGQVHTIVPPLVYAQLGYAVLALKRGGKAPATRNGLRDATPDEARIAAWHAAGYNIGLLPPERVLVLDADTPEEVARLERDYPELTTAPRCDTPRGGAHIYTRLPDGVPAPRATCRLDGRELDVRGMGRAYLVAPPSTVDGSAYRWVRPLLAPEALPETPRALLGLLVPPAQPPAAPTTPSRHLTTPTEVAGPAGTPSGVNLADRARRYALSALQREHDNVASAAEGTRNDALNRAAYNLGQLVGAEALERAEVEEALRAAAETCGLPADEAARTIASGLEAGMREPREIPEPRGKVQGAVPSDDRPGAAAAAEAEAPWEPLEPLPDLYPPVPPLPPGLVPEPLRAWLEDIAERTSLPLEYVAAPALVSLGAVIGRKIGIYPKRYDDWLVVPNLWGGIVGRPGVMKTAAISEATRPLRALAAAARERYQAEAAQAEAERARLELEVSALKEQAKRDAKKGGIRDDFAAGLQSLMGQLAEATVTERRYLTQDATTEKLGELLRDNPRGMLLLRDELAGWLRTLERPGREGEREFYLEAWNGTGGYTFDRIGRGTVHIDALCLSILGAIQPGKLEKYLQEAIDGGGGADGLLQRFQLVVWPDTVGEYVQVDRYPNSEARCRANAIFEALDALDPAVLGLDTQEGEIPALHFTAEAQALFYAWRGELEARFRGGELMYKPAFESHLSKYRSLMPSLALIFHLVAVADGTGEGAVSLEAAQLAAAWCDYLEAHARKLYAPEVSSHIRAAQALAQKIEDGAIKDKETVRNIYNAGWEGLTDRETVRDGLEVLAEKHWVRLEAKATGGRPSQVVRLHPELRGAE